MRTTASLSLRPHLSCIGDCTKPVNEAGIKYYSDLIDALLEAKIQPAITIFHWDHPQALEDSYGSFASERIVDDFVGLAKVLFERLGDRCKFWITINEVSRGSFGRWIDGRSS